MSEAEDEGGAESAVELIRSQCFRVVKFRLCVSRDRSHVVFRILERRNAIRAKGIGDEGAPGGNGGREHGAGAVTAGRGG